MQTTAGRERVRIGEDTGRRRQAHIDRVRARQASEADRMRELAGEGLKTIKAWADAATQSLQLERRRGAAGRGVWGGPPPEPTPEPASAGASGFVDQSGEAPDPAEPVAAATGSS